MHLSSWDPRVSFLTCLIMSRPQPHLKHILWTFFATVDLASVFKSPASLFLLPLSPFSEFGLSYSSMELSRCLWGLIWAWPYRLLVSVPMPLGPHPVPCWARGFTRGGLGLTPTCTPVARDNQKKE